jgi:hypothetical protein
MGRVTIAPVVVPSAPMASFAKRMMTDEWSCPAEEAGTQQIYSPVSCAVADALGPASKAAVDV